MKRELMVAISNMTEAQAVALWEAVAQWVDNARCGVAETDAPESRELACIEAAELVELAGEVHFAELARS